MTPDGLKICKLYLTLIFSSIFSNFHEIIRIVFKSVARIIRKIGGKNKAHCCYKNNKMGNRTAYYLTDHKTHLNLFL